MADWKENETDDEKEIRWAEQNVRFAKMSRNTINHPDSIMTSDELEAKIVEHEATLASLQAAAGTPDPGSLTL